MTGQEAYLRQIAEVKAHMGELRSADGRSVERLLAARAAEPTRKQWENLLKTLEAQGKLIPFDAIMAEFGLTEADLEQEGT